MTTTQTANHRPRIQLWYPDQFRDARRRDRIHALQLADMLAWCLHCRIECSPAVALRAVRIQGGYNNLEVPKFAHLLRSIDRIAGRRFYATPEGHEANPNNGSLAHRLHLGNEGSMVLYVQSTGYHTSKTTGLPEPNSWTDEQIAALEAAAIEAGADEYWITQDPDVFRIWWD